MNLTICDRSARFGLLLILIAFVLIALIYSVSVPLGEAPDEVSHWSYVQYLTMHQRLPVVGGAVAGEAHQPPLYYLLGALVSFWVPTQQFEIYANPDWYLGNSETPNLLLHTRREAFPYRGGTLAWHLVRLVSIALGATTVWATFQLAQEVFPENQSLALIAAAIIAFIPQFTFLSAVVNNDNLIIALSALAMLVFLRTRSDRRAIFFVVLGVLLGLAALAKISAFALWLTVVVGMFVRGDQWSTGKRITNISITFATAMAVLSPWIIYNLIAFGDPLGMARMSEGFARTQAMTWSDWAIYGERMFFSFWGRFGGVTNVGMPIAVYAALTLLLLVGLIGDSVLLRDWRANKLGDAVRQGIIVFALFWLILIASHLRLVSTMLGIDQARQWFPALPALGVLVAAGIARLASRSSIPGLIITCGIGLIGITNAFAVASVYAPTAQFANISPPNSASIDFDERIRLLDYRVDPRLAAPGDRVAVDLRWQALSDLTENDWLMLRLDGSAGMIVIKDGVPSGGNLTTDWWQEGQVLTSRHILIIPSDCAPGTYTLRLGLHPYGWWEWLPVRGGEMFTLGTVSVTENR